MSGTIQEEFNDLKVEYIISVRRIKQANWSVSPQETKETVETRSDGIEFKGASIHHTGHLRKSLEFSFISQNTRPLLSSREAVHSLTHE